MNVEEDEIDDFTGSGPWEIRGETYKFVEDYPSRDCDGECHNVVVKRKSDGKYFQFSWVYTNSGRYYYEPEWEEVKQKKITKVKWGWGNKYE
jgi:hypothetical protein